MVPGVGVLAPRYSCTAVRAVQTDLGIFVSHVNVNAVPGPRGEHPHY